MTATLQEHESSAAPDPQAELPAPSPPSAGVQLRAWRDPHPWHGIALCSLVGVLAAVVRMWNVAHPYTKVFDEVYYSTEAQELLRFGYEDNRGYMFVVHPPLGKWLIAITSAIFGNTELGWRLASGVAGTIAVVITARVARRMFRSNLFGFIAGLLLALEGLSVVLSRIALLDIFMQPFIIGAFATLVCDRDQLRERLAQLLDAGADLSSGAPSLGPRPWRLVAGVLLGLGCGVKWSGLSFFVLLAVLSLVWDRNALRSAGVAHSWRQAARRSWIYALGSLLLAPLGAYLLCWTGWFAGNNSWNRHWADTHRSATTLHLFGLKVPFNWGFLPHAIRSLGEYTYQAYRFHSTLYSPHPFSSKPWGWVVMGRPIDLYYSGKGSCGASSCSTELLMIGTPILWWAFLPALLWAIWHYACTRDWRAGAVLLMLVAGWLVWFQDPRRTMFIFYMTPLVPFLVLGLTLGLGVMLGPRVTRPVLALRQAGLTVEGARARLLDVAADRRRLWGILGVCAFLALVIVDFLWMWPLFRGGIMTNDQWQAHMWLPSWV